MCRILCELHVKSWFELTYTLSGGQWLTPRGPCKSTIRDSPCGYVCLCQKGHFCARRAACKVWESVTDPWYTPRIKMMLSVFPQPYNNTEQEKVNNVGALLTFHIMLFECSAALLVEQGLV